VECDAALVRLADIALGCGAKKLAEEARAIAERVAEGRFYVACAKSRKTS
jgi:hypothetical protein